MRALAALALYVSLACGAETNWNETRDRGLAAYRAGDFRTAAEHLEKSWNLAQTRGEYGLSADDLGITLHRLGREKEAALWLERALEIWKGYPDQHVRRALTTASLVGVWRALGQYAKSEQAIDERLREPVLAPEARALLLNTLGDILREQGRLPEARALFERALLLPGISLERQSEAKIGLADLHRAGRRWTESIAEWSAANEIARAQNDHPTEAAIWRGMGQTWLEQGSPARAEPLLRRALAVFESDPNRDDTQVSATLASLAQLYLIDNKTALAEDAIRRAISGEERVLGPEHPQVAILLEILGDTVARRKQMELARGYFGRAWRIVAATFGADSPMAGAVLSTWATVEQRAGEHTRAAEQYAKALAILRSTGSETASLRLYVLERYAETLKATHRKREASQVLSEAKGFRAK